MSACCCEFDLDEDLVREHLELGCPTCLWLAVAHEMHLLGVPARVEGGGGGSLLMSVPAEDGTYCWLGAWEGREPQDGPWLTSSLGGVGLVGGYRYGGPQGELMSGGDEELTGGDSAGEVALAMAALWRRLRSAPLTEVC